MKLKSLLRSVHQRCRGSGRQKRRPTPLFAKDPNPNGDDNEDEHRRSSSSSSNHVAAIPPSIIIDHVFPFLDRQTQNKLCVASKNVYNQVQKLQIQQPWPHNTKCQIKKVVSSICFSPSSDEVAFVTTNSKIVTVWNRRHGFEQNLVGHQGQCSSVTYGEDFLVTTSYRDGTVRLWVRQGCGHRNYRNYLILNVRVFATLFVRVSPDSQRIASFGDDGKIYLSDSKTGALIATTTWRDRLFVDCYDCVAFSNQQHSILAHTFNNQTVKIWNWEKQTKILLDDHDPTILTDYKAYIASIQFVKTNAGVQDGHVTDGGDSNKPEYLAVGCAVARVKLWRLEDYTCVRTFSLGSGWSSVTHLVFSMDGTRMACTGDGSHIRIFDLESGECIKRLDVHKKKVNTLSISPDGTTLASGSNDRTLRLHAMP